MENRASNKAGKCGAYACPTGTDDPSDYFQQWWLESIRNRSVSKKIILA
jgi:hypothetical protein